MRLAQFSVKNSETEFRDRGLPFQTTPENEAKLAECEREKNICAYGVKSSQSENDSLGIKISP